MNNRLYKVSTAKTMRKQNDRLHEVLFPVVYDMRAKIYNLLS